MRRKALLIFGAVGLGLAISASTASAWTVSGSSGPFSGAVPNLTIRDTTQGLLQLSCPTTTLAGSATNGSGLSGIGIASLTGLTFGSSAGGPGTCSTLGVEPPVSASGLPAAIDATSYDASTTTTTGVLRNITIAGSIPSVGCTITLHGDVGVRFDNTADKLSFVAPGTTLSSVTPTACGSLTAVGHSFTMLGASTIAPASLAITNP